MPTEDFTPGHKGLEKIVMHWGDTYTLEQIDNEVANPNRQMSYHYALDEEIIHQYVSENDTAWHCGVFSENQKSIGICINAREDNPYTDGKYETAAQLIASIYRTHGEVPLVPHSAIKPTQCPGPLDFDRLNEMVQEILHPAVEEAPVIEKVAESIIEPVVTEPAPVEVLPEEVVVETPVVETPVETIVEAPVEPEMFRYTVIGGDNLWNITKRHYGLTHNHDIAAKLEEVKAANPNLERERDWDLIYPDDIVLLP